MLKHKRYFIFALLLAIMMIVTLSGCRQSDRVSYNLSVEADDFNVARKLTVINIRTDTVLFKMQGNFSIEKEADGDLAVIGENDDGTFYKHFVLLSTEVSYIVEDLGTTGVNKYKYEINFNPKMAFPIFDAVIVD